MRRFSIWALVVLAVAACDSGRTQRTERTAVTADLIIVEKAARRMRLIREGQIVRTYRITLGGNPVGHKRQEGDSRTPEGNYVIDARNPNSRFHLSLRISYPNEEDRRRAAALGVSPGGDIFIHGLPNHAGGAITYFSGRDWTDGCIAVTNEEIREIWAMVTVGTPIEIRP